jgi:acyl transferase domain-containing protein
LTDPRPSADPTGLEVAIVGMAGRFPGARDLETLWRNLRQGVESISFFSTADLLAAGIPADELRRADYVPARAVLDEADRFDAGLFGYSPREAEIMDPQHRVFLECAWEALENAGYDPQSFSGRIGVYAGASMSTYLLFNLLPNPGLLAEVGSFQAMIGNDKDYLPTRVSYKLNLTGPSVLVQSACSTSLVAVHLACQSLLNGECEMALAGGISISFPQTRGYRYEQGAIFSPDGHCRAFDAEAQGTVNGEGAGIVVLRRLEDALAAGSTILAVIKGSAINNDGSLKVGFTAPSVDGQAAVIRAAQIVAGVDAGSISYVETHGTGTPLGDPIEIRALSAAFRATTPRQGFCALGSLKTNFGHLDVAAGIAGLIKTVLALRHREIPPHLHFRAPNQEIDLASSPFYVNTSLREWPAGDRPRRAAVSSFGIGGTNAHLILEEAPALAPSRPGSRPWQLLVLSARTDEALEAATDRLAAFLAAPPEAEAADVAYTLQAGRRAMDHRRAVVCSSLGEAATTLSSRDPRTLLSAVAEGRDRPVFFLFPGQGAQYPGMAHGLYEAEPVFREEVDRCSEYLRPRLGLDLRQVLFTPAGEAGAAEQLRQTRLTQPALFVIEHALARLWRQWGVQPAALCGHSIGEYVAACLAGVFSLEDALDLVAARGQMMQDLPAGAMLSVSLPRERVVPLLGSDLSLAAVNAGSLCVVAGPPRAVAALGEELARQGIEHRPLHTSHAFHSAAMEPIVEPFRKLVAGVERHPPRLPWVSNVTGSWITGAEATDPVYWSRQLREPVLFFEGLAEFLAEPDAVLLEVGPGRTLGTLVRHHPRLRPGQAVIPSLRHPQGEQADPPFLLRSLGRLWLAGVKVDWKGLHAPERRRRIPLPGYPFAGDRYWVAPPAGSAALAALPAAGAPQSPGAAAPPVVARHARAGLATSYAAPGSPGERAVAAIWEDLLGVAPVGLHDDFFDLGGHSLLATRVTSRLREAFGVEVPVRRILEAPTVAELAAAVEALSERGDALAPPPIRPLPRNGALPLSFAQARLFFLDQVRPGRPEYNIPFALRLRGRLDAPVLEWGLREIERRHEALRTTFALAGGEATQVVSREPVFTLPAVDLRGLPATRREPEARRQAELEAHAPFDLHRGPLFRATLLRLDEEESVLLFTMHHIVSDGWSFSVVTRELSELYRARLGGEAPRLPALPIQYADFAVWQRRHLQGEVLRSQLSYWTRQLARLPRPLRLPVDRPAPAAETWEGAVHPLACPAPLARGLAELGRGRRATMFMTLLAAYSALLHCLSEDEDLCIGSPVAGRVHQETEELIGFFVNTLVLRCDLAGDPSFLELLDRLRQVTLAAYAHQDLPFEQLVSGLRLDRDPGRNPLFRVWFVLQNTPPLALDLPGLEVSALEPRRLAVRHDLKLELAEKPDGLKGYFEYRRDLFDASTVARIAEQFGALLERVVERPAMPLSSLREAVVEIARHQQVQVRQDLKRTSLEKLRQSSRKAVR